MTKLEAAFEHVKHLSKEEQEFIADWLQSIGNANDEYELSDEEVAEIKRRQATPQKTYSMEDVFGSL